MSYVKSLIKQAAPSVYRRYVEHHNASLPLKVAQMLADTRKPVLLDEQEFGKLQTSYAQWWPSYNYGAYWNGLRAYERAISFLELDGLQEPGMNVLEVACGDGMLGPILSAYGHHVTLLDYQDWRDARALDQKFIQADLSQPIDLPDSSYDFIYSFNAFEHIPDPALAFNEIIRLLKPGGFVWLDFNPIYSSPLGLHAFSLKMPYPQFLFSEGTISSMIKTYGLYDLGQAVEELQPLNRWRVQQFRDLWKRHDCNVVTYKETTDHRHLEVVMNYPQAFRGRGLCLDDLTVSGIRVVLRKGS